MISTKNRAILSLVTALSVFIAISNSSAESIFTENKDENKNKIMQFYVNYEKALIQENYLRYCEMCDSLMNIYCTQELCNIMKDDRVNGIGYDFMTNDYWMDDLSLKTLCVTAQESYYIVSYQVIVETPQGKVLTNVKLQVEMGDGKICRVAPVGKKAAYE